MQNNEGQERYCEWLRGKGKNTSHYKVQRDVQAREQAPKGVVQEQAKGKQGKKVIFIILNSKPEATQ